jgi:hypothetical protein
LSGPGSTRTISRERRGGILCYALGGGLGHLTRSLALGRQLRRRGCGPVTVLTNSPRADLGAAEGLEVRCLQPVDGMSPAALATWVQQAMEEEAPRLLIVDAFPRGLLGELPGLLASRNCPAVLVLRRLREDYVQQYDLPPFIRRHYDRVLLVEKGLEGWRAELGPLAQEVPPILIRSAAELLPPEEARERLRCPREGRVVLGVGAGDPVQVQRFLLLLLKAWTRRGRREHLRLATAQPLPSGPWDPFRIQYYPLFELFRGISLVVGACGYHLFHETQAAAVPALFLPQTRLYDDQFARAAQALVARDPYQLERLWGQAWTLPPDRPVPAFINGAEVAAEAIVALLSQQG